MKAADKFVLSLFPHSIDRFPSLMLAILF